MALTFSIIAIVLAIVSFGWSVGWSIYQHRTATRVRLYATAAFQVSWPPVIEITATNTGPVPVTITGVLASIEGTQPKAVVQWWVQQSEPLPQLLTTGTTWTGLLDQDRLVEALSIRVHKAGAWELIFEVMDAADGTHRASNQITLGRPSGDQERRAPGA
jgi:hypothetical protein